MTGTCDRCGCRLSRYRNPDDRYCWPCQPSVETARRPAVWAAPAAAANAYEQRVQGLAWTDIADNLGFDGTELRNLKDRGSRAYHLAKRYAERHHLPWPPAHSMSAA